MVEGSGLDPNGDPAEGDEVKQEQSAAEGGVGIHRVAEAKPAWRLWSSRACIAVLVVVALVAASTLWPSQEKHSDELHTPKKDALAEVRADAQSAIQALSTGDLLALDIQLADHRGETDFAYLFASQTTPRALGDALASIAGIDAPLKAGVDAHAYDIALTDLAGTLGLATFGTGDRALPTKWTDDFITATTDPAALHGEAARGADDPGRHRADQDLVNKQNLLLLLSRGYWSTGFLEAVTDAYWQYDQDKGNQAWPVATVQDGKVAPAPTGRYLTDGILALTAALTANPEASAWAFTEFQPGTRRIEGSDFAIGKFTHYLLFEHRFPESSDGGSVGMTATLTALSSAVDFTSGTVDAKTASSTLKSADGAGPTHDSVVLRALAKQLSDKSGCSWNPLDYWHCSVAVTEVVMGWIRNWGHLVLELLAAATFFPPLTAIGVAAAAANATWYAIDGDYLAAGLSLAAVVAGLKFAKIARSVKVGKAGLKAATEADDIAKVAKPFRSAAELRSSRVVTAADVINRPNVWATTKAKVLANAGRTPGGDLLDANTGDVIRGPFHFGHKPRYEWRCMKKKALELGWTIQELRDNFNNPSHFQIEDPASNLSHEHESDKCAA